MSYIIEHDDCIAWMRRLPDACIDAIVTDPPYGLGFMGKAWDALPPGPDFAAEALRILKPGGHLVAFGGTRTCHRLTVALEDAGLEIRDVGGWVYYSGFPKSLDVVKAITTGGRPEDIRRAAMGADYVPSGRGRINYDHGAASAMGGEARDLPATDAARAWSGWGTALKPAIEPWVLARKSLVGTVAQNVLAHGTGALNIDGCRLAPGDRAWVGPGDAVDPPERDVGPSGDGSGVGAGVTGLRSGYRPASSPVGRWPANLYYCPKASRSERERGLGPENMLCQCETTRAEWANADLEASIRAGTGTPPRKGTTGSTSEAVSGWLTSSSGSAPTGRSPAGGRSITGTETNRTTGSRTSSSSTPSLTSGATPGVSSETVSGLSPAGSAASSSPSTPSTGTSPERAGPSTGVAAPATSHASSQTSGRVVRVCPRCLRWDRQPRGSDAVGRDEGSPGTQSPSAGAGRKAGGIWCIHPTVKPVRLMRWLVRLVTPPGGIVLDPFLGSGTTGIAAVLEGASFVGVEREVDFVAIATARIEHAATHPAAWASTAPGAR